MNIYMYHFDMLKKLSLFVLSAFMLMMWSILTAKDYEFVSLDVNADLQIDWTIDVTETFVTNFLKSKHGIIRTIPLNYTVDNTKFHIDLDYIRVDWNKFTTYYDTNWLNIKIWDPNRNIKWEKIYPISYTVYWLVRNFAWLWYSELYRNIVWYDFDTNINKVKAEIILPKSYNWFVSDDFLITVDWNASSIRDFNGTIDWTSWNRITITYNGKLDAWEWITLAIKFPKDYFMFDHDKQSNLLWYVDYNWLSFSNSSSNSYVTSSNTIDPDYLSSIITVVIMVFGMWLLPSKNVWSSSYSWWSYSSYSWFSSCSSFSSWWFSRGWWGGWWGSKSR